MKTLHRTRGLVQDLTVTGKGGMVTLWSEGGTRHSVLDSSAPHLPGLEYARNMLAALAFCPHAKSCLMLGLGGGSIPRMLLAARPQIEVDAVEIDPAVVELASMFFHIRTLPHLSVHVEDAAVFLSRCTSRYGIIIVDTYVGEQFPNQCATREFIHNARTCLIDDGVLAVNWLSDDSQMRTDLLKNLESIVGTVWQLRGLESRNILYFAATGISTRRTILSAADALDTEVPFKSPLKRLAQRLRNVG